MPPRLGDILLRRKSITADQLDDALAQHRDTRTRLGQVLVSQRAITGEELSEALMEQIRALGPPPEFRRYRTLSEMARKLRPAPVAPPSPELPTSGRVAD